MPQKKSKPRRQSRNSTPDTPATAEPGAPFVDYWQLRMEGATARLRAARRIISHTGTRGALAENLLKELISDFLPRRWAVGTGFILDAHRRVSKQVDILVYDVMTTSPLYRDGDLVALAPGTAKIAVEVKSQLDSKGIPEAFENLSSVKQLDADVYGMIFGYDGVTPETFADHVREWAHRDAGGEPVTRTSLPDRVYNLEQEFLVVNERPDPGHDPGDGDKILYWVLKAPVPVPRFFLAELLARLNMDRLRDFLPAEKAGAELAKV